MESVGRHKLLTELIPVASYRYYEGISKLAEFIPAFSAGIKKHRTT